MGAIQAEKSKAERVRLTRPFSETVAELLQQSADFRHGLLSEAADMLLAGELSTLKILLREFVNGTLGFVALGAEIGRSPKSLMRMLGPQGNPQATNLLKILAVLQKREGVRLKSHAEPVKVSRLAA